MPQHDTIAAIATAPGRGGIGIIRLSGPLARDIAEAMTATKLQPRHAHYCQFHHEQQLLDNGVCLFFPAPHSFTGEDVVELQAHGGPVTLDLMLQAACQLGARLAGPGEFSERAFLNDKMDLAQAEAIADLINSSTAQGALNASQSLAGVFSQKIDALVKEVTALRVYIEAAIDFPEEEIDFIAEGQVAQRLAGISEQLDGVFAQAQQGSLIREGMKLVIAGKPNAGKSSLLNALAGNDVAIVTAIAGTTRDVLREHIELEGMPLHIVDTAGLRSSADEIEQEGIRRAWQEIASADHILLVVDDSATSDRDATPDELWPQGQAHLERDIPVTIVRNKCDLSARQAELTVTPECTQIVLSARTGEGLDLLRRHLKSSMGFQEGTHGLFSARRRHLESLEQARSFLLQGQQQLLGAGAGELLAEDLRQCQNSLGKITGVVTSDALLGEIFSSFCIGK